MYLSRKDIEAISKKVLNEYYQLPKIKIQKRIEKIEPLILAENLMGLNVDFQHLSLDNSTFGLTSYYATITSVINDNEETEFYPLDGNTILVEKDLADEPLEGKFNFTIGHETSHHILRKLFPTEYGPQIENGIHYYRKYDDKPKPITDWEEWQATVLTSAILMPEDLLIENMQKVGLGSKMTVLNTKYNKEAFYKFCHLTSVMGVSVTALRIRMKYLGLLEKDYYCNPQGIFDIEFDK